MPTKLRKLVINEISLVDRGANQHAHITLFKRDAPEIEVPKDSDRNFNASGRGATHDKLWVLFDDRRRALGPAQGQRAFAEAWSALTDTDRNEIRNEEARTEAARQAAADAAEAERKREMNKMDDKLDEIKKLARDIVDGKIGNHATRQQFYAAIRKAAEAQRKPNETREMAFSRYVTEDPDGKVMFKAMRNATGVDYVPPAPAVPVVKATPARDEINKLADKFVTADPLLTKYSALLKVHAEMPELAAKAKAEAFA